MAAVNSPQASTSSFTENQPPASSSKSPPTPSLSTSQAGKRTPLQRPPSYARNRISSYSTNSRLSERASRALSTAFPAFHSSLPYALVRDFAYPVAHPCHYGPPPVTSEPASGVSTPASEQQRRLPDDANGSWGNPGSWGDDGFFSTQQLPQMAYGDGPPYSEDEDLHSPIVKSSRHKKYKSAFPEGGSRQRRGNNSDQAEEDVNEDISSSGQRSYSAGEKQGGTRMYSVGADDEGAEGREGEFVAYSPDLVRRSRLGVQRNGQRDSHFAGPIANRSYGRGGTDDSEDESLGVPEQDDSRYSRDYQFTIASPDEEMHGKAVALFDFARENENELPLTEGQVIWVSYRHGQGWLVAEDPKTGDAGLVPEEYVRLLRDIEGGLGSLGDEAEPSESEEASPDSPTEEEVEPLRKAESPQHQHHSSHNSVGSNTADKNPAVVSSFSTSSKDLDPYPHPLLGTHAGQMPPQVVHYGSQTNTPTIRSPSVGGGHTPRNFDEIKGLAERQKASADENAKTGR